MTAADARTSPPGLADPVDQAAAEEASAFGHPPVPPDATAAYGGHPDQVIDFYRPRTPSARPAPLVALLHGGAWRSAYDRVHISPLAAHLAAHGFAVASLEYRRGGPVNDPQQPPQHPAVTPPDRTEAAGGAPLRPAGRWPETFDDVAAALDALPGLALRALGDDTVDPQRTLLSGHSAGGHLALWAAARHVLPPDSPWHLSTPPPLRGVVALAPVADLASAIRLRVCSGAVVDLLGGPDHLTDRIPLADPAALLPTGIATTIVHGTTDNVVPPQVSEAFARAAAAAGEGPVVAWLAETGHFPLIDPASPAVMALIDEIGQLVW
ncbi:Acetyl esterase/lipase [Streptomyces sp. DvalAA-14]|uniref:alpha/beta hydrolase family protein n=1 Tax=unclassified Streptomyces TaxID=2593676 RepID=UPI00081B7AE5|nr:MULTISPECIES: alpha/beta hydrolase [unclassified Streptomyces]MYS20860.1 alpha/beta hydrolase fold domain-containing protein [Streptomyces sp. SID4948]SCD78632.1 Acetyl esterase/lipase [Streptomyces sp. DvalAA-14]